MPFAFFSLASVNILLSLFLFARVFRLPSVVLLSPFLDWTIWVLSGNAVGWICLLATEIHEKTHVKHMLSLGLLTLAGSILSVLPSFAPGYELLATTSLIGGFLMSFAVIASTGLCVKDSRVLSISSSAKARILLTFLFALIIPLEVWSLATMSLTQRIPREYPFVNPYVIFERLLALLFPITVVAFTLLITGWLWLPFAIKLAGSRIAFLFKPKALDSVETIGGEPRKRLVDGWSLLVGLAVVLGVVVSVYRLSHGRAPGNDYWFYSSVLVKMNAEGNAPAFSTDRPFLFLCLHGVEKILGLSSSMVLSMLPVALSVLLVVATYLFARFITGTRRGASLAAVFAAVSPHVTVAIDYFIVANWCGIVLMMLFFYCMLRSVARKSIPWASLTVLLSALTLGAHYFTWLFSIAAILIYLLFRLVERPSPGKRDMMFSAGLVAACIAVLAPALFLAYVIKGGIFASVELVQNMIGTFLTRATPMNFITFLLSREFAYNYFGSARTAPFYYWGREHYSTTLMYLLAIIGLARLVSLRDDRYRLLKSWFIASCLGTFVVYYNEWWRFLYMIPLEILAAFGFVVIVEQVKLREELVSAKSAGNGLIPVALLLSAFLTVGLLAFSSVPSFMIVLPLILVALIEFRRPSKSWEGIVVVLTIVLALEQALRALYILT